MKGAECLGSFTCFMLCPEMMAASKHLGFHPCYISISTPLPPIKKKYIDI